jgi:hypothetical protein
MSGDHNANQKPKQNMKKLLEVTPAQMEHADALLAQIQAAREPKPRQEVSERSIRTTIGMMRTLASNIPISPFHLHAADQMERMLDELLRLRKRNDRQETET